MHRTRFSVARNTAVTTFTVVLMLAAAAGQVKDKVLHSFGSGADGLYPFAGMIFDNAGNLYGTTYEGGTGPCNGGCGIAFELMPGARGKWTESILYTFQGRPSDAGKPSASLIFDASGNLYGTSRYGGGTGCTYACGTVFELSPGSNGWTETILHAFTGGTDGENPFAELISDTAGNLYSTTYGGGAYGRGTVFELSPSSSGWTETILFNFKGRNGNGPLAGLIFDASGNLYGTTGRGGTKGHGVVFELSPSSHGSWKETVLYNFAGSPNDGAEPSADLIMDSVGNLYSTTRYGGSATCTSGCGTVFELSPGSSGKWTESVLYLFTGNPDGAAPFAGLILDGAGNLYGTTDQGGPKNDGIVFKLTPGSSGWTESIVHSFRGWPRDGARSYANLITDGKGNYYGATIFGGANDPGTIFEITPQ